MFAVPPRDSNPSILACLLLISSSAQAPLGGRVWASLAVGLAGHLCEATG